MKRETKTRPKTRKEENLELQVGTLFDNLLGEGYKVKKMDCKPIIELMDWRFDTGFRNATPIMQDRGYEVTVIRYLC